MSHNLAQLPIEQRQAMERSKRAFHRAKTMLREMNRKAIRWEIYRMPEGDEKHERTARNAGGIMSRARIWYAEDIADIMERQQTQSLKQIARVYGVSDKTLADMTCKARAMGFAAYPKRSAT